MTSISGEINLRPTRIGFLVRPADTASISRIMRWSTCLWGGWSNPIIPVGRYPVCWREDHTVLRKPTRDLARKYMKFFEPDVLIEAEPGLAASIGYGALAEGRYKTQLLGLDDLYSREGASRPKLLFGLSVIDAHKDIYQSQHQFVLRDSRTALFFNDTKLSPIVEAVFGALPREERAEDFSQSYNDVFRPVAADFGRSIKQDKIVELTRTHLAECPQEAFHPGGVWHPEVPTERHGPMCERHALEVDRASFDAELIDGKSIRFDTVAPDFANRFGGGHYRWANVVTLRSFRTDAFALVYPSNLEDRTTPRLSLDMNNRPIITREGWVLGQHLKGLQEWIELSDGATAIGEWLERKGIQSALSDAGKNAKQMIESLGGLWGSHLIADEETIRLLNSMAMQEDVRGAADDATRRQYEGRTFTAARWWNLIAKRAENHLPTLTLNEFTKHGILKLGLGVVCPNCTYGNWFSLDDVS